MVIIHEEARTYPMFFFHFFRKSPIVPKKEHSAPKTTFSQAEISFENEKRTF